MSRERGVLFSGSHNLCASHSREDVEQALRVYRDAMEVVGEAVAVGDVLDRLQGQPVQPVFRRA